MRGTGRSQGRVGRRRQWVAGTAMRHRTATTARPLLWGRSRLGRAPVCAGAACATQLWFAVCVVATVAVLLLVGLLPNAEPAFRYGSRPITGPTRHRKLARAAAQTVRYCIAVRNAGGMVEAARTVESIATQTAMAVTWGARTSGVFIRCRPSAVRGRHAMRRPSGVTTRRCRRLGRSARRRWRTR